jgi:SAM-dependent methyltransferase
MTFTENRVDAREVATRIAGRFESRFMQGYVRGKLRSDPVYPAVLEHLRDVPGPILDVGCGVGLLGLYLREHGLAHEVIGIDFDRRKIETGRSVASGIDGITLEEGDARVRRTFRGSVAMLDLLHYFSDDEQRQILENAADYARPGDVVVIRDCIRDGTWRYRLTWLEESFATSIGWLRGERLNFPTRESIVHEFRRRGFEEEIVPLWGRTPFNNYLLTFRCR